MGFNKDHTPHLWLLSPAGTCLPVYHTSHRGTKPCFTLGIFNPRTAGLRIVALNKPARGIYPEPDHSHISLTPPRCTQAPRPAEPWHIPTGYLTNAKPHGEQLTPCLRQTSKQPAESTWQYGDSESYSVHIVILMSTGIFTPLFQGLARKVFRNLTPPQIHESTK